MSGIYPVTILEKILKKHEFSEILVPRSVYLNNQLYSDKSYVVTYKTLKWPDVYDSYIVNIYDKSMATFKDLLVEIFDVNPDEFQEVLNVINYLNEITEFENYIPFTGVSFIYFEHISKLIVSPIGSHFNLCINTANCAVVFECVGGGKELETIEPVNEITGDTLLSIGNKTLLEYVKYYLDTNLLTPDNISRLKHFSIKDLYSQLPIASHFNYVDRASTFKFFADNGINLNSGYSVSFKEKELNIIKSFFKEVLNHSDYASFSQLVDLMRFKQKLESSKFECLFSINKIFKTERLNHCSVCAYSLEIGSVKLNIGQDLLNLCSVEPKDHNLFNYYYEKQALAGKSQNLNVFIDIFKQDFVKQIATVVQKDINELTWDDFRLYEIMFEKTR